MIVAGILVSAGAAYAHHSFSAVYDQEKRVSVSGVVKNVEWLNPHAWIYIEVKNDAGGSEVWGAELGSPNGLMRIGWKRDSLKPGEAITAEGFGTRDGSKLINLQSVTRADGTKMFTGDPVQGGLK